MGGASASSRDDGAVTEPLSLADGWDAHADEWIAWSRTGRDSYETIHRDVFLPLVPGPGRLTVDVGCGEGRVSRDLRARGHRVLAFDRSPAMCLAAAAHPDDPVPAVVADATALPLPDAAADCVVAFMSLHDIDRMPAAVAEAARILDSGGHLVFAVVHPINSAGRFTSDKADPDRPFVIAGSYLEPRRYVDVFTADGMTVTFHGEHRPVQAYTEALAAAGFAVKRLLEVTDPDPARPWRRVPLFLDIVAVLLRPNP